MSAMAEEGRRRFSAGDARGAVALFEQLLQEQPHHPGVNLMMGMCFASISKHEIALQFLERANASGASSPEAVTALATSLRYLGRIDEASALLDRHLAAHPDDRPVIAAKADLLHFTGRNEDAAALLEPALDRSPRDASLVLAYGRVAHDARACARAADLMLALEHDPSLTPRRRSLLLIRLGGVLDRLGRYDEAFAAVTRGHALAPEPWDASAERAQVERVISAWTPEALAARADWGVDDPRPVFIVGMPRSGTTLIEQIVDAHPSAFGAGELPDIHAMVHQCSRGMYLADLSVLSRDDAATRARRYLARLSGMAPQAQRVTDKAPLNYRHVGLISVLFPRAKIVHALRDPLDTCLSCFFQSIAGHFPQGRDLGRLGAMYVDHLRLMAHWKRLLPGRILDVRYEDVVDDLEGQTRRLLEFIGLAFDERCLRFWETGRIATTSSNDQVRRPLYRSSVARHERYAAHLGPLKAALAELHASGSAHPDAEARSTRNRDQSA